MARRGLLILAFLVPAGLALVLTTARHQPLRAQDGQAQARMQARIKALEDRLQVLERALEANNQLVAKLQERLEGEQPSGPPRSAAPAGKPWIVVLPLNVRVPTEDELATDPEAKAWAFVRVYRSDGSSKTFNVKVGEAIGKQVKTREGLVDYRVGTLVDATVGERKHPRFGYQQQVHSIRYRTRDGEVLTTTNRDPAPGKPPR